MKAHCYRVLMLLYSLCGRFASQVATNGSWTDGHIRKLWGDKPSTVLIYPPCDTSDIVEKIPLETQGKKNQMISFAQFRPEKDHELQLVIWKDALPNLPKDAQFVMIGATRGPEDKELVQRLKAKAKDLGISDSLRFMINESREAIIETMKESKVAIHTMKEEHFGISVVEMMSAGLVTIAHASGGPQHDIIGCKQEPVGFLAKDQQDYAQHVVKAMNSFEEKWCENLRKNARQHAVDSFGVENFNKLFTDMLWRGLYGSFGENYGYKAQ